MKYILIKRFKRFERFERLIMKKRLTDLFDFRVDGL